MSLPGGETTTLGDGTATSGGGTPDTGGRTPFLPIPAEFNHWWSCDDQLRHVLNCKISTVQSVHFIVTSS